MYHCYPEQMFYMHEYISQLFTVQEVFARL